MDEQTTVLLRGVPALGQSQGWQIEAKEKLGVEHLRYSPTSNLLITDRFPLDSHNLFYEGSVALDPSDGQQRWSKDTGLKQPAEAVGGFGYVFAQPTPKDSNPAQPQPGDSTITVFDASPCLMRPMATRWPRCRPPPLRKTFEKVSPGDTFSKVFGGWGWA